MNNPLKISISNPCQENWEKMTPNEKGKFCSICQKNVFDFTKSTDEEIIEAFNKNKNLCGRYNISQLNRNLSAQQQRKPFWVTALASIVTLLGLGNHSTKAQIGINAYNPNVILEVARPLPTQVINLGYDDQNYFHGYYIEKTITLNSNSSTESLNDDENQICEGILYDEKKLPLKNIFVKNSRTQTKRITDNNGFFSISVKKGDLLFCSQSENPSPFGKADNIIHEAQIKIIKKE